MAVARPGVRGVEERAAGMGNKWERGATGEGKGRGRERHAPRRQQHSGECEQSSEPWRRATEPGSAKRGRKGATSEALTSEGEWMDDGTGASGIQKMGVQAEAEQCGE